MLSNIFNTEIIKEKLPKELYLKYIKCLNNYESFPDDLLNEYILCLNKYIKEHNIKYYSLIFYSLDKRFIIKKNSLNTLKYNDLFNKEIDASSLINGGLIDVSNSKGYVSMDTNSFPFIYNDTLYIPSLFFINNNSLDNKTPLLKSIKELNKTIKELLNKLNDNYTYFVPSLGIEQEFFLMDNKTKIDIKSTYLNPLNTKQNNFINNVIDIAKSIGIDIEGYHHETSINQLEIIMRYNKQNIVLDSNNYLKEIINQLANKYNYNAIFIDKPFKQLNGSGKHNNYSLKIDNINLLDPSYKHFLLIISGFILAIDNYYELLRLSSSSYSNERRLKEKEAPGTIISLSLCDLLISYLKDPKIFKNTQIDYKRNRTSPIVFVGNKFEFRMLGSSIDATLFNTCLNTILIDAFKKISKRLDNEDEYTIIKDIYSKHQRIIYNESNYSLDYLKEMNKRKLKDLSYYESLDYLLKYQNLFIDNDIMNINEITARYNILKNQYINDFILEHQNILNKIDKYLLSLENELIRISKINKEYIVEYLNDRIEFIKQISTKLYNYSLKLKDFIKTINEIKDNDKKYLKLSSSLLIKEINECFKKIDEYIFINHKNDGSI